jgi:SAM-dependent methyltransferase
MVSPASESGARERFDRLYARSDDPWNYRASDYERLKYGRTLKALPAQRLGMTLEVGCSVGVFTRLLAERCTNLVAIDFSAAAVELARTRVVDMSNVSVLQASFPDQVPPRSWDVIICSEVLYYLEPRVLEHAITWLRSQLRSGASLLAVSWRGIGRDEPHTGDQVHDRLLCELRPWHVLDARELEYRIDRFDGELRRENLIARGEHVGTD